MIKKNKAPFTGLDFPEIGFGASPFGNIYNTNVTQKEADTIVRKAIEKGITYFDVAPYYGIGRAETILGQSLPKQKDKLILSTKIGRYGLKEFDFSKKKIEESVTRSLKNLGTDHIDIVFCHDIEFVEKNTIINEAIPALVSLKEKGYISHVGISGYPLTILGDVSKSKYVDIVLSYAHYTILNQSLETFLTQFKKNKVDVINASPFCMGLLTQNNCPEWHPYKDKEKVHALIKTLSKKGLNIEKESFQFCLNQTIFSTTLTGISSETELNDILNWANEGISEKNQVFVQNSFKNHQNINWT